MSIDGSIKYWYISSITFSVFSLSFADEQPACVRHIEGCSPEEVCCMTNTNTDASSYRYFFPFSCVRNGGECIVWFEPCPYYYFLPRYRCRFWFTKCCKYKLQNSKIKLKFSFKLISKIK